MNKAAGEVESGTPLLFTPEQAEPAREAVAEIQSTPTHYLGPAENVTILPVLSTDPEPIIEGRVQARRPLRPRPYARVVAPRKGSDEMTIELETDRRAPRPLLKLLAESEVHVPAPWRAGYRHRFGSRRRSAEVKIPVEASPATIVAFACEAIEALGPAERTGRWLAVRSQHSGVPRSMSG